MNANEKAQAWLARYGSHNDVSVAVENVRYALSDRQSGLSHLTPGERQGVLKIAHCLARICHGVPAQIESWQDIAMTALIVSGDESIKEHPIVAAVKKEKPKKPRRR